MAAAQARVQVKRALRAVGFELRRFDPDASYARRRQRLIEVAGVDLVIDVGAHAGEFAGSLRHEGYRGRILSIEPQSSMFSRLEQACASDPLWDCRRHAVGASPGTVELHISGNDGFSSSIRPMASIHEKAEPTSAYVGSEAVEVLTLDEAVPGTPDSPRMLKVDTQGYEAEVLAGAAETLAGCSLVELELVLTELYEDQALFTELVGQMAKRGFVLTDVESGFRDPKSLELLQIDGLFTRREQA